MPQCRSQKHIHRAAPVRASGIQFGTLPAGKHNAITDVPGTSVGHVTLVEGDVIRTGITAVVPASGNLFQRKVSAAVETFNGFGKLTGQTQVQELGNLETPILLTNTLSVPVAMEGLIEYTLAQPGNEAVRSVNALVGETNDGMLNDIRRRYVRKEHARVAERRFRRHRRARMHWRRYGNRLSRFQRRKSGQLLES